MRSSASAPTLMHTTVGWPTSPATSLPGACGCRTIRAGTPPRDATAPAPGRRPRAAILPSPVKKEVTEMDAELLSDTFVDLADTMVAEFDVIDFLHMLTDRSARLLSASAAGVLLADPRGQLRVAAASSEAAGLIELFQIQNDQGPCLDCFRTGQPVTAADLAGLNQRWPRF